jgi:hypothetical protein
VLWFSVIVVCTCGQLTLNGVSIDEEGTIHDPPLLLEVCSFHSCNFFLWNSNRSLEDFTNTLYVEALCLGIRCSLCRGKLKWNQSYPQRLIAARMRILCLCFIGSVFRVLVNIMTQSPIASGNVTKTQDADFCTIFCVILGRLLYNYVPHQELMNSVWIMAANHYYSWRWWSDALWVTLIRLWLYSCLPC